MSKKRKIRKLRSLTPRHGRAITFCGAPCDLDQGNVCADCKELHHLLRNQAARDEERS